MPGARAGWISMDYLDDETADMYLRSDFDIQNIPAHMSRLEWKSRELRELIKKLNPGDALQLDDSTGNGIKEFLQFFYPARFVKGALMFNRSMRYFYEVMRHAKALNVPDYHNIGRQFLDKYLNVNNVCVLYNDLLFYKTEEFREQCESLIALKTKELFACPNFKVCTHKVLENILRMDLLSCSETDVFLACMKWAEKNAGITNSNIMLTRNLMMGQLCPYYADDPEPPLWFMIRFRSMTLDELYSLQDDYGQVFAPGERDEITKMIEDINYVPVVPFEPKMRKLTWVSDGTQEFLSIPITDPLHKPW